MSDENPQSAKKETGKKPGAPKMRASRKSGPRKTAAPGVNGAQPNPSTSADELHEALGKVALLEKEKQEIATLLQGTQAALEEKMRLLDGLGAEKETLLTQISSAIGDKSVLSQQLEEEQGLVRKKVEEVKRVTAERDALLVAFRSKMERGLTIATLAVSSIVFVSLWLIFFLRK